MTVNKKIPNSCKAVLLTGQQCMDLLPAIELLTDGLIFIDSIQCKSRDIDVTMSRLRLDGLVIKTSNRYVSGKSE